MRVGYFNCSETGVIEETLKKICQQHMNVFLMGFRETASLFHWLRENEVDLIFLDSDDPMERELSLLYEIRNRAPAVEIVLIRPDSDGAFQAFQAEAFGYALRSTTGDKLEKYILRLQKLKGESDIELPVIRTFGRFDLFTHGRAVHFSNKKAKELLALLVDQCGGTVTMEQAIDTLWEHRPYDKNTKALYRIALKNLRDTLQAVGCSDILIENRGQRSVDVSKVRCDYYDFISNNGKSDQFHGEYMTNYEWGEYTLGKISEKFYK